MLVGQVSNILHKVGLVDTVGNLGDYNLIVSLGGLNLSLGAHHNTAPTRLVGIANTLQTIDIGSCGEVGSRNVLHQPIGIDIGIVNIGAATINNLAQIVGRHIGSHTYGNTVTTIDQQVRNLGGHYAGLYQRIVEVVDHIDGVLLQVVHDVLAHLRETALGVTHGSWRVAIDTTEVTLSVDECITHVPVLGHTNEGTID